MNAPDYAIPYSARASAAADSVRAAALFVRANVLGLAFDRKCTQEAWQAAADQFVAVTQFAAALGLCEEAVELLRRAGSDAQDRADGRQGLLPPFIKTPTGLAPVPYIGEVMP